ENDAPRNATPRPRPGAARNDENLLVPGLALGVLQCHDRVVDTTSVASLPPDRRFDKGRRIGRWHYQWAVIHDFLARLVGPEVIEDILHPVAFKVPVAKEA